MFGFRSHAFGVVSDHALVSFLFQRTHKKKAEKEKPIDEDLADSTGLMEKLRKRRAGLRKVYGKTTCTILFVDLPSSCLLQQTCVRHADTVTTTKTHDVGESDFFSSAAWSSQHTDNRNARLRMVSWQEKKEKKKSKKKWTKTPDSRTGGRPCVARDHCWALTRERKTMTKHERRIASELCAWFNYKKKKGNAHILLDWFWEAAAGGFPKFEQTSGDPSPLSVDVLLTTIDTRWFMQENRS